jgi:aryl-alcohol dehydrogenase-like predicted oxidoreductase
MEQRRLGHSGLRVSRLALGTMTWGLATDEHEAKEQLRVFRDAGGTLIDTAAAYGDGASESMIGQLVGSADTRADVVLATKAGISRRSGEAKFDTSRRALLDQLDASLERLCTDHVDLWQVHRWTDDTPLEETLGALDFAVSSGRARYVGVSNYSGWQTARAVTWQQAWPGRAPVVSTQVEYSLLARGIEREVLPAAEALGVGALAWSPLAAGVLTGKYRTGIPRDSRAASQDSARFMERFLHERGERIVDAVVTAADGLGVSAAEVALSWVRDAPGVTAPVVGARTAAQLRQSLAAERLTLPAEIRSALDDVSAVPVGYPER